MDSPSAPSQRSPVLGFALLVGLICAVAAGKAILFTTFDPDAFWHLRVADQLAQQGPWPHEIVDQLSFSSSKEPWTPYSWLAERGMKALWDFGGYRAAIAAQAAMQVAFIVFLALGAVEATRLVTGRAMYLAAIVATAMGAVLSLGYLSFRPNTAAIVLLSAIGWLLLRDRRMEQKSKAVWLVPPLTVLLANIHFFSILVPMWTGALLAGDAIEKWRGGTNRRVNRDVLLTALCAVASIMTPLLPGTFRSVVEYSFHDPMVRSNTIVELGPFYQGVMGHVSAVLVAILVACIIWRIARGEKISAGELIWLCGGGVLLFKMGRMAPMFAIIAAPLFAATMPRLSDRLLARPLVVAATAIVLLIATVRIAGAFPPADQSFEKWLTRLGPDIPAYPCAAADYVDQKINRSSGHLICEFTWGGYLEWRLGEHYQTLMDGRIQIFPAQFWKSAYLSSGQDCQRVLQDADADVAILPKGKSHFRKLLADMKWETVYEDDQATVMIPQPPIASAQ